MLTKASIDINQIITQHSIDKMKEIGTSSLQKFSPRLSSSQTSRNIFRIHSSNHDNINPNANYNNKDTSNSSRNTLNTIYNTNGFTILNKTLQTSQYDKKRRREYKMKKSLPYLTSTKTLIFDKGNNIMSSPKSVQNELLLFSNTNDDNNNNNDQNNNTKNKDTCMWKINQLNVDKNKFLHRSSTFNATTIEKNWKNATYSTKIHSKKLFTEESPKARNHTEKNIFTTPPTDTNFFTRKFSHTSRNATNLANLLTFETLPTKTKGSSMMGCTLTSFDIPNEIDSASKSKNRFLERSRYSSRQIIISQKSKDKFKYFVNNVNIENLTEEKQKLRDIDKNEYASEKAIDDIDHYNVEKLDQILNEYKAKSESEYLLNPDHEHIITPINSKNTNRKNKYDEDKHIDQSKGKTKGEREIQREGNKEGELELNTMHEIMKGYSHKLKEFCLFPNDNGPIIPKNNKSILLNKSDELRNIKNNEAKVGYEASSPIFKKGKINFKDKDIEFIEKISKKSLEIYAKEFNDYTKVDENTRKLRYQNIRKNLRDLLSKLAMLNITLKEFMENKIFSTKPFERDFSKEFIRAAKDGDNLLLSKLLKQNKYLVYDFDHIGQTALHWACKRNLYDIARFLIDSRSDINAMDMTGRPPLYYALRSGNPAIVKLLLLAKANPWNTNGINLYTIATDFKVKWYLRRARHLNLLMSSKSVKERENIWKIKARDFFLDELHNISKMSK